MTGAVYHIIAIVVAVLAVVRGYRRGLTGMVTSVLGLAFGVVCSHIFCEPLTESVLSWLPHLFSGHGGRYLVSNLVAGGVFLTVYFVIRSVTWVIRMAMAGDSSGLLNSLLGAFFCVVNYLLMLSLVYNVLVGLHPDSALMRYGKADDGNIIEAVMWIAPAALGSERFADFAHSCQLEEAKKISQVEYEDADRASLHPAGDC